MSFPRKWLEMYGLQRLHVFSLNVTKSFNIFCKKNIKTTQAYSHNYKKN